MYKLNHNEEQNILNNFQTQDYRITPIYSTKSEVIFDLAVRSNNGTVDTLTCRMTQKDDKKGTMTFHVFHPAKKDDSMFDWQDEGTNWITIDLSKNDGTHLNKQYSKIRKKVEFALRPQGRQFGATLHSTNNTDHGLAFLLLNMAQKIQKGWHLKHKNTKVVTYNQVNDILNKEKNTKGNRANRGFFSNNFGTNSRKRLKKLLETKKPGSFITTDEIKSCLPKEMHNDFERELVQVILFHTAQVGLTMDQDNIRMIRENAESILNDHNATDHQCFYALLQKALMSKGAYRTRCYDRALKLIQGIYRNSSDNDYLLTDLKFLVYKFLGGDNYSPDNINENDHKMLISNTQQPKLTDMQLKKSILNGPNPNDNNVANSLINGMANELGNSSDVVNNVVDVESISVIVNAIKKIKRDILDKTNCPVTPAAFKYLLKRELQRRGSMLVERYYHEVSDSRYKNNEDRMPYDVEFIIQSFLENKSFNNGNAQLDIVLNERYGCTPATQKIIDEYINGICSCYGSVSDKILDKCIERLHDVPEMRRPYYGHNNDKEKYDKNRDSIKVIISCLKNLKKSVLDNSQAPVSSDKLKIKFLINILGGRHKVESLFSRDFVLKFQNKKFEQAKKLGGWDAYQKYLNSDNFTIDLIREGCGGSYEALQFVLKNFGFSEETAMIIDDTLDQLAYSTYMEKSMSNPNYNKSIVPANDQQQKDFTKNQQMWDNDDDDQSHNNQNQHNSNLDVTAHPYFR